MNFYNRIEPFLHNRWVVMVGVGIAIFALFYIWTEKVITFVRKRSVGQRDEVMRMLDLMFVDVNRSRITTMIMLLSFGLGFLALLVFWPNITVGLAFGAALGLAGWALPTSVIKSLYQKRCNRFVGQMVDGLTIMANGIKSGLSVTQSMERVVENMGNPISQEFGLVLSQIKLGRSVEESLIELGERIPRPDVQMFVTAINILKETGGNLAETFQTIVVTIRERQKVEQKIEAMTAQGMMQGLIISLVPFLLLVVFQFVDPGYTRPLYVTTLGWVILAVMMALVIIGGITIRKIVKIKV